MFASSLRSVLAVAALAGAALAQNTQIGAPEHGAQLKAGSNLTVEVQRPVRLFFLGPCCIADGLPPVPQNSLTGSHEVAVVIGLQSCVSNLCAEYAPGDYLGSLLYSGSFNPQYAPGQTQKPPHQNYTVTVPSYISKGAARVSVAHWSLVGVRTAAMTRLRVG
jgi:hypothetical protein